MSQYNGRTAVLVDQHPLWLDAVSLVVEDLGMTIVGTATSGRDGLALVTEQRPDVLVTGIQMPAGDIDGIELVRIGRENVPTLRAIVLSIHDDTKHIDAALAAGAVAYVIKTAHPDDLRSAIRQAFAHSVYLPGSRTAAAVQSTACPDRGPARPDAARAGDPAARGGGALEHPAREDALGDRADGQVPPVQRLSQARRREPDRGQPLGAAPRPALDLGQARADAGNAIG